jgi:hypothetical protein
MTAPIVSVVMSVFNGERFLREAIESILDQSFTDFEFIVVDDGSTDDSVSILDSYQNCDARVKVYHHEHGGLIESLNQGCCLSQGKYIARMDADDIASKDRLTWQVDYTEAHPGIGVLGGAVEWIDAAGKSLRTCRYPSGDGQIKTHLLHGCALWHPTVLLRREVFVWAGGYRKVVVDAEDYDLWLRIADRFQLENLEAVVLKYRIHPQQTSFRKLKQQSLSILAAQVSASQRRNGDPDLLETVEKITPELLVRSGVPEAKQQTALASYCRHWARNVCLAGEFSAALKTLLEILQSSDLEYAEAWLVADLWLTAASLHWRQREFFRSLMGVAHAVTARPAVIGRPIKQIFIRMTEGVGGPPCG